MFILDKFLRQLARFPTQARELNYCISWFRLHELQLIRRSKNPCGYSSLTPRRNHDLMLVLCPNLGTFFVLVIQLVKHNPRRFPVFGRWKLVKVASDTD